MLDLGLLVIKNNLLIQFVKSTEFKVFCNGFMSKNCFSFKKNKKCCSIVGDNKTKICYTKICKMLFVTTSFDLWMSKGTHHISALVKIFLKVNWQPCHITIGLFEANENYKTSWGKKNNCIVGWIWIKKKNCCLCLKWRGKLKCNNNGITIYG